MKRPRHPRIVSVRMALDVTPEAARILDGQSRIANWLWNDLLETCTTRKADLTAGTDTDTNLTYLYSRYAIRNAMVERKTTAAWLCSLHSSVTKNVAMRLRRAIADSRQEGNRAKPLAWPTYKRWSSDWFSLEYDEPNKGFHRNGRDLVLSLGRDADKKRLSVAVRLRESPPDFLTRSHTRSLRITRDLGTYYAVFTVSRDLVDKRPLSATPRIAAIDPGHRNVLTIVGTDGVSTKVPKPTCLIALDRRIDATKSRRDHCVKKSVYHTEGAGRPYWSPSRRWNFYNAKLNALYTRRREQTKTWEYTVLNRLYHEYDLVAFGNYAPHGNGRSTGERRSMNGRSLIGSFKTTGAWIAERSGAHFTIWNERGSTRTCAWCGAIVIGGLTPDIETWLCFCGRTNDRDENAAQNGLMKVSQEINMPCSGPREIVSRRTWRLTAHGVTEVTHTPERRHSGSAA